MAAGQVDARVPEGPRYTLGMARNASTAKPVRGKVPPQKPIWERIMERGERIPDEALTNYPEDGAKNLHHYLHGHPKQDPD